MPDLIVNGVTAGGFYVLDRGGYLTNLDSRLLVPHPGFDPNTGNYDLPGSWGCRFVRTSCVANLTAGSHLAALSGELGGGSRTAPLTLPTWTVESEVSTPLEIPPPVAVDPAWCALGPPLVTSAEQYLCAPGEDNLAFQSLVALEVVSTIGGMAWFAYKHTWGIFGGG